MGGQPWGVASFGGGFGLGCCLLGQQADSFEYCTKIAALQYIGEDCSFSRYINLNQSEA